jgi:hypothetical protein
MVIAIRKYTIDDILARLQGVKKNGSGYMACCPAHEDKNPSLSISEKDDKVLLKCFAGCTYEQIMTALDMPAHAAAQDTTTTPKQQKLKQSKPLGKIVQTYDYTDMNGALLFQVVRYEPKAFKQRRPDGKGGWNYKLDGVNTVPYHLYELWTGIKMGQTIYIAEGEKDVDNLRGLGLVATCNPRGAGQWKEEYTQYLEGAHQVIIITDKDLPGRKHSSEVALLVHNAGIPVKIIEMPGEFQKTEDGYTGIKDFSDWLYSGGKVTELETLVKLAAPYVPPLAQDSLRQISDKTYCIESGKICWIKQERDGSITVPLCNFTARVTEEITRDDGVESNRYFRCLGNDCHGQDLPGIEVPAANFSSLSWVVNDWGMRAIIGAGMNAKDRLREAIQLLSQQALSRRIYTHTGWRHLDGTDVYLSQGGAIGCDDVDVELEPQLQRYCLSKPDDSKLRESIRASINFLYTADMHITLPLWAAMYMAPLAEALDPAFTLWMVGPSGSFKSTLTALVLNHFGDFDQNHLPASWRDTANQLEKLLFLCKDMPLVIDDWAPGQDSGKARELEVKAEHIVRAQGNRQGRGRMRSDTSSRPSYFPRGMLLTSGEMLPSGHSHTARIFTVQLEKDMVDQKLLTTAQHERYLYRQAMAQYIKWLQPGWMDKRTALKREAEELRNSILADVETGSIHARLPDVIAMLCIALNKGLDFAKYCGELTANEYDLFKTEGRRIFIEMACEQGNRVEEQRPGQRAIEAIQASIRMGTAVLRNKADASLTDLSMGKIAIGWRDFQNGHVLLDPEATYQAIVQHSEKSKRPYTITPAETWKDLLRLGYSEEGSDGRPTIMARITALPKSVRVIKLKNDAIGLAEATPLEESLL